MNKDIKKYYLFRPSLRIAHWVWVLAISVLFVTGIYIGNPFFIGNVGYSATFGDLHAITMNWIRLLHFSFGYILLAALILRFSIIPFRKADRLIIPKVWTKAYWDNAVDTLKNYLFITKSHKPYIRNPLARTAYFGIFLLLIFEVITGFAMFGRSNPGGFWDKLFGWVIPMLGGKYNIWHLGKLYSQIYPIHRSNTYRTTRSMDKLYISIKKLIYSVSHYGMGMSTTKLH